MYICTKYYKIYNMPPIGLRFIETTENLTAKSKWWGAPDLPEGCSYPCQDGAPLTFVCQIRCEDIFSYDRNSLLPKTGMLYFFAAIGEYLDGFEIESEHNGIGEWPEDAFRVLYSPDSQNLSPYEILWEDDNTPAYLPAEKIEFFDAQADNDGYRMLCRPFYDEIAECYPDSIALLQIDESDRWKLRLYDCGMLCFMATPSDIAAKRWDKVKFYFHSF